MRVSYFILLTAATLVSSGDVVCANENQAKLSKVVYADATQVSVDAIGADNKKRGLQFHYDEDENDKENDDDVEEEEEERAGGANLFKESKLMQMMSGIGEFKRYKNLKAYGYTPISFQNKLQKLYGKKYKDLWQRYTANYLII